MAEFGRVGIVGRWQPLHFGHQSFLEILCEGADEVVIGIGSSNVTDERNPFTAAECRDMINLVLKGYDNYEIVDVQDLNDCELWKINVAQIYGGLDYFVSGNPWVEKCLPFYELISPYAIIPEDEQVDICATEVREGMNTGDAWKEYVNNRVAAYMEEQGLIERYRMEYGKGQRVLLDRNIG